MLSPLVSGTLGERVGWHWGFGAAGFGMMIGAATYFAGRRRLPQRLPVDAVELAPLTPSGRRSVIGIVLAFIPYILVNAAYQQAYALMLVWADTAVDHTIGGWTMPITWMVFFDGVMSLGAISLSAAIWKRAAARGRELHDITKLGIGCAGIALAFTYAAGIALVPGVSWIALVGVYLIIDLSCAWFEASTGSLTSRYAPYKISARMMGVFKLALAFAYFLLGWLSQFYEKLGASRYWAMTAAVAAAGAILVAVFGRTVQRMLDPDCSAPPEGVIAVSSPLHS